MSKPKMNPDEVDVDLSLARRLVATQCAQWADLPISEIASSGTDHAIYRLGDEMAIRLPRRPSAVPTLAKEQRWLPRLAPLLPLAIPMPLAQGAPAEGFPFPWSVYRWLDGQNVAADPVADMAGAAVQLGQFVTALQRIDTTDAPLTFRGGPLSALNDRVCREIRDLGAEDMLDPDQATAIWETAIAAPPWDGPPLWVHADLNPVNLLACGGRLTSVIDFGELGIGDPAIDLLPAWAWLTAGTRALFRSHVEADDATWVRGRGWALGLGVGAVRYYQHTNPVLAAIGQRTITEAATDCEGQISGQPPPSKEQRG